jgi:hypothetical protein
MQCFRLLLFAVGVLTAACYSAAYAGPYALNIATTPSAITPADPVVAEITFGPDSEGFNFGGFPARWKFATSAIRTGNEITISILATPPAPLGPNEIDFPAYWKPHFEEPLGQLLAGEYRAIMVVNVVGSEQSNPFAYGESSFVVVPEPASLILAGMATVAAIALLRQRFAKFAAGVRGRVY